MKQSNQDDLNALRQAGSERDWEKCRLLTQRLLLQLGQAECTRIAVYYAESYLSTFHEYHPDVDWPARIFEGIEAVATTGTLEGNWPPDSPKEWPRDFPILSALQSMWFMPEAMANPARIAKLATDAISRIFMSTLEEHWCSRYPELWERKFLPPDERDAEILSKFFQDPDVAALDTSLWHGLAGEIEKRLRSLNGSPPN
jgi:hypothetical protein